MQVHQDQLDHEDLTEAQDNQEHEDQMDKLDHLDLQDHQELLDKLETKELLAQPEIMEFQEQLDQLVPQDLQDHQEISATCCLVTSGTLSMETKESPYTEANELSTMIRRTLTWINSLQGATNCSRISLISGRWSPTNTSNTKDWEQRMYQQDHADTCSN